jgi:anti-sigma B factor antagonist
MPEVVHPEGPMPGELLIESRTEDDRLVLSLRGELDLTSVPQFERELREAETTSPSRLVIDLSGLDFMDSTGLRALLQARERAKGEDHELALRRGPRQVQRVLELTKTLDVFTFED